MDLRSLGWLALSATISTLAAAEDARAVGFRCDPHFVSEGNTTYEVLSRCGEPDMSTQRVESRTINRVADVPCGRRGQTCKVLVQDFVSVMIEDWTYDFGPQRLIQYLTFEQGKLIHVESGGYGHKQL